MSDRELPSLREQTTDTAAYANRYRPALVRYFQRHLGNRHDAEDLAQEALARLCRSASAIENVEAYLMRIASNLLRDRYRRDQTQKTSLHDAFDEWNDKHLNPLGEVPGGDRVYEGRARLERFLQALDELSPRCRQVFLLQRYDGMTYSAIAKRLGISMSAVEKHMMRALLHFDSTLEDP